MAQTKSAPKAAKKSSARKPAFTAEERAAMKERSREAKASPADGESDLMAKIAEMPAADQAMAKRIHEVVKATAPELTPRTYYGMPAYARNGKVVCFFKPASKFKMRYATLGFNDTANLDDGAMWPTEFALKELTEAEAKRIGELVKKALS